MSPSRHSRSGSWPSRVWGVIAACAVAVGHAMAVVGRRLWTWTRQGLAFVGRAAAAVGRLSPGWAGAVGRRLSSWARKGWALATTAVWLVGHAFAVVGRKLWAWVRQAYSEAPRLTVAALAVTVGFLVLFGVWVTGSVTHTSASGRATGPNGKPVVASFPAYTVTALQPHIDVHSSPGGPTVLTLNNPLPEGAPLTLLMTPVAQQPGGSWVQVFLPIRPNGSTGFVHSSEVHIQGDPFQLVLSVSQRHLTLYRFGQPQYTFPTAVGAPDTPTPTGTYFLSELLKPTNPDVYGDYAYGLSGHSPTLQSFEGYDAELGLHGTGDPSSVGQAISHGCVRLYNPDIDKLAAVLPLGTPITIQA